MNFFIFSLGLTAFMLSSYLEWRCKREEGSRPPVPHIFVFCGRSSLFVWTVLVACVFQILGFYLAAIAVLLSMIIPAFISRAIIAHDKSPTVVPLGFLVGLIVSAYCIWG